MKIAVLGLGNPVLTDDAVGLKVIEELEKLLKENPVKGVETLQSTRAGFELIDLLTGFDYAIVVDAFLSDTPEPGRLRKLSITDFAGNARLIGAHDISIDVAFELAKKINVPMPKEVEIFAIEVEDVYTLSEEMTEKVAGAVESIAREIYRRVREVAASNAGEPESGTDAGDKNKPLNRTFYPPQSD